MNYKSIFNTLTKLGILIIYVGSWFGFFIAVGMGLIQYNNMFGKIGGLFELWIIGSAFGSLALFGYFVGVLSKLSEKIKRLEHEIKRK